MPTLKERKRAELRYWEARRKTHLRDAAKARKIRTSLRGIADNPLRKDYATGCLKLAAISRKLADAARNMLAVI